MAIRRSWAMLVPAVTMPVLMALTGCANDPARPSVDTPGHSTTAVPRTTIPIPTTTLPDLTASYGLAASIRQFREDEVADVIQIEVVRALSDATPLPPGVADAGGLLTITSVDLEWPGFAFVPPTARTVRVAPGQRVDLPTPLGPVVCDTEQPPSYSLGHVVMTIDPETQAPRSVRAPLLADAQAALDNVWTKGCVRQRLLDRVGLAYSSPWTRTDPDGVPTATADLVVTRKDTTEPIEVTGVDGSVLLFVNPATPLPNPTATIATGTGSAATPLVVTGAGRCDGHALSDSKKTYIFQVLVKVGDAEPVGIDLAVPDPDRALLNQVIVDTCGTDHRR